MDLMTRKNALNYASSMCDTRESQSARNGRRQIALATSSRVHPPTIELRLVFSKRLTLTIPVRKIPVRSLWGGIFAWQQSI